MQLFKFIPALFVAGALIAPTASAQQSVPEGTELARLAEEANTPAAHANVAKQYRARANELTLAAQRYEADVKRLETKRFPVEHKQMVTANRPLMRARQQAMEARRGALEARTQAALHTQLSVELMAAR